MLRYAIGFLCLLPFALAALRGPRTQPPLRDLLAMAALGTGQFGILIALLNFGLQHVAAAPAALIFSLFPLLTLLLAAALGREQVTAQLAAGVLLSIAGVALSLGPKLQAGPAGGWWGEAAIFASACVGALCSVLYRPYLQRYPTVPVSAFAMLASVLFLAAAALVEGWPARVGALPGTAWAVVGFIGLSSGVGYFWWLYALNPVTAAILGWLLLREPLPPQLLGAVALIAAGLVLATRTPSGERQARAG
jgi:drug/metabolite transporter (DMT)-like permease